MKTLCVAVAVSLSIPVSALDVGFRAQNQILLTEIKAGKTNEEDSLRFRICQTAAKAEDCILLSDCFWPAQALLAQWKGEKDAGLREELEALTASSFESELPAAKFLAPVLAALKALDTEKKCLTVTGFSLPSAKATPE